MHCVFFVSAVRLLILLKFVLVHTWLLCHHVVVAWQFILCASVSIALPPVLLQWIVAGCSTPMVTLSDFSWAKLVNLYVMLTVANRRSFENGSVVACHLILHRNATEYLKTGYILKMEIFLKSLIAKPVLYCCSSTSRVTYICGVVSGGLHVTRSRPPPCRSRRHCHGGRCACN